MDMRQAQAEYDNQDAPDTRSPNAREYQEGMTAKAQLDLCLEYLDDEFRQKGLDEYLFNKAFLEKPHWIREYVESLTGFWDFVG